MASLLEGLNPAQQQAVLWEDGPCGCVAGAGAGKTRVLTLRIQHLIHHGVHPDHLSEFATRYPSATSITLDSNYRSLPDIVTCGNRLINGNTRSTPKAVQAAHLLAHGAVNRARDRLILIVPNTRHRPEQSPSQFITEMGIEVEDE